MIPLQAYPGEIFGAAIGAIVLVSRYPSRSELVPGNDGSTQISKLDHDCASIHTQLSPKRASKSVPPANAKIEMLAWPISKN